jgi:hypothetical protein
MTEHTFKYLLGEAIKDFTPQVDVKAIKGYSSIKPPQIFIDDPVKLDDGAESVFKRVVKRKAKQAASQVEDAAKDALTFGTGATSTVATTEAPSISSEEMVNMLEKARADIEAMESEHTPHYGGFVDPVRFEMPMDTGEPGYMRREAFRDFEIKTQGDLKRAFMVNIDPAKSVALESPEPKRPDEWGSW